MRRLLAIVLLVLFSSPLISPLLALTGGADASLPACCRRNGAHHCMAGMRMASDSAAHVAAPPSHCPRFPSILKPVSQRELALSGSVLIFAGIVSHPAVVFQTQARARVSLDRSRRKRGPPSLLS